MAALGFGKSVNVSVGQFLLLRLLLGPELGWEARSWMTAGTGKWVRMVATVSDSLCLACLAVASEASKNNNALYSPVRGSAAPSPTAPPINPPVASDVVPNTHVATGGDQVPRATHRRLPYEDWPD